MKAAVSVLIALGCLALEARADCAAPRSCTGTIGLIQMDPTTARIGVYVRSANPGALTFCKGDFGSLTTGYFVLQSTHPLYQEVLSGLQAAAVVQGQVTLYASQTTTATANAPCELGAVDFPYM